MPRTTPVPPAGLRLPALDRRGFLGLTAGLGAAALLSACGGPSTASGTQSTAARDYSGVTPAKEISWWTNHPGTSTELEKQFVAAFNKEHPEITVNIVTAGKNYDDISQKFQAALTGTNLPDLVLLGDVTWFRFFVNGNLAPLGPLVKAAKIELPDYVDTLVEDYQFADAQWGLPYCRSTPLFYYNKDQWKAAGLPDRGPQTWAEFAEWAPRLQARMPSGHYAFGLGKGTSWAAWWFENMVWGYGGAYSAKWDVTIDSPQVVQAGEFLRGLIFDQKVASIAAQDQSADLAAGIYASSISSTGSLTGVLKAAKFEVGTSFLPAGPKGFGCPTGGAGLAIPAKVSPERQLAAAMFLEFLGRPEQAAAFSKATGYMPVRKSAIEGAEMQQVYAQTPQFRTAVDQLAKTRTQDWARVYVPSGDQIITTGIERITLKNEAPQAVFTDLKGQLEKAYQQNVKPYLKA